MSSSVMQRNQSTYAEPIGRWRIFFLSGRPCSWAWMQCIAYNFPLGSLGDANYILLSTGQHNDHRQCPGSFWNTFKAINICCKNSATHTVSFQVSLIHAYPYIML